MRIRIESGSLLRTSIPGVGYYTKSLIAALSKIPNISIESIALPATQKDPSIITIDGINHRVYTKLNQFKIAPYFDAKLTPVDLTIFPDFSLWPTKKSRIKAAVVHDLTYKKYPEYMRTRTFGPIKIPVTTWYLSSVVKRAVRKADFVITVSNSTKDDLLASFKLSSDKIVVTEVPPSEDFTAQKQLAVDASHLLKKYSIPTRYYILSVGTIEPRKNQLATLRAYLLLPTTLRSRYSLVFAGVSGWSNDVFLKELRKAQDAGENIVMTGYFSQNDAYALYSHATIFTSASHYEGFGMPVLEAMVAGTPTILSDIPIYREVSDNASLFINQNHPEQYAQAIIETIENKDLRTKLIHDGYKNVRRYSWQANATRIIAKTEELLK